MPNPRGLENATKIDGEYDITDSSDSTWKEHYEGTDYYVDPNTGQITAVDYKGFDDARNQKNNWVEETGRKVVTLEEVPEKARQKIKEVLSGIPCI